MSNPSRPNRPAPRAGATAENPQAEQTGRAARGEQNPPTATGGQQTAHQLGGAGAHQGASEYVPTNESSTGNAVPLEAVFQLATWAAQPSDDPEECTYRRGQVKSILYSVIDGMFPS